MANRIKPTVSDKVMQLMEKGVRIPSPFSVEIGEDVCTERISGQGVTFFSGTRIYGKKTLICAGTCLGSEAPVTLVDCLLGPHVELRGGYFKSSVFLEKAGMAGGAHVREGCLLEEEANGSHTVGLKQTILFPFVTLGSLINFCDCFMAGGTSRKNHSEVGSSYIHFNYTPHQDKATPSLIGDVPRGVMLNQPPIFLGGQGGLVGPVRIGYGCVIAAGTLCRRDCPEGGKILCDSGHPRTEREFHPGLYKDIEKKVFNNIYYVANLLALRQWYHHIRRIFFQGQELGDELYQGAVETLQLAIEERLTRCKTLSEKMEASIAVGQQILSGERRSLLLRQQKEFMKNWPDGESTFTAAHEKAVDHSNRDAFLEIIRLKVKEAGTDYINVITNLDRPSAAKGTAWLQNIVDHVTGRVLMNLPSFRYPERTA